MSTSFRELWLTDKGMGNSVILNGKNGSKKPETVVGFDQREIQPPEEDTESEEGTGRSCGEMD